MKKLVLALVCSVIFAQLALAEDDDSGVERSGHKRKMNGSFSFSPRYYQLNSDGYSPAFGGSGFNSPSSGTVGFDFRFFLTTHSDWQFGFGFGDLGYSNSNGASTAEYTQDYFGLWVAKSVQISDDFEITFGSLFSWGTARVEVISAALGARTDEESFILAPKLIAAYKVAPWLKVGVSGSYLEPLAQSDSIRGANLTPGNISIHGASAGVEFIFGYFGPRPEAEETHHPPRD